MAPPRILIVAGSDSGGGAGIQADIKTLTALGGYAMTAITALTAQNTRSVANVMPVDPAFVGQQMDMVLEDIGADAIKLGMLLNTGIIEAVTKRLSALPADMPIVIDPVMIATSGSRLLKQDAIAALIRSLLTRATVLTPNIPEAEALLGRPITTVEDMMLAARYLQSWGPQAVLLKGGHLPGRLAADVLVMPSGAAVFEAEKIDTAHTHGTGCTLASAIAYGLATGQSVQQAVELGRRFVRQAIATAPGLGHGNGPLNHLLRQF